MALADLRNYVERASNPEQAIILQRFFKTGKGQYGEGDIFAGIKVPVQRQIAKENLDLTFNELKELLHSRLHEERLIALLILVLRFPKADEKKKEKIFSFYMKNRKKINNWDLVDLSAPNIVGAFLFDKNRDVLYKLAASENLWEKRLAIISTFFFIRQKDYRDTLAISKLFLNEEHDLIHKAVGWMLREIGNRNIEVEEKFLKKHYSEMPRTMLRYAIEKFPEEKRKKYLRGEV